MHHINKSRGPASQPPEVENKLSRESLQSRHSAHWTTTTGNSEGWSTAGGKKGNRKADGSIESEFWELLPSSRTAYCPGKTKCKPRISGPQFSDMPIPHSLEQLQKQACLPCTWPLPLLDSMTIRSPTNSSGLIGHKKTTTNGRSSEEEEERKTGRKKNENYKKHLPQKRKRKEKTKQREQKENCLGLFPGALPRALRGLRTGHPKPQSRALRSKRLAWLPLAQAT